MGDKDTPVTISIVGTGNTEGGGVAPTPDGTTATTPGDQPNLIVNVVTPIKAIGVRFVSTFLTTFGGAIGVDTFNLFALDLRQMALLALSAGAIGLIKNLGTIFGRLEGKYPLLTGSI